jgi:hypothetical protein
MATGEIGVGEVVTTMRSEGPAEGETNDAKGATGRIAGDRGDIGDMGSRTIGDPIGGVSSIDITTGDPIALNDKSSDLGLAPSSSFSISLSFDPLPLPLGCSTS